MIRILTVLLLSYIYLFGAVYWTLSGINKANIYVNNQVSSLKVETVSVIKDKIRTMLKSEAIKIGEQDSPILIIDLSEIEDDDSHYIYVQLSIGEDVQTYREDRSSTFALTYMKTDFIETDSSELDNAILESIDTLLTQFKEDLEDEREE